MCALGLSSSFVLLALIRFDPKTFAIDFFLDSVRSRHKLISLLHVFPSFPFSFSVPFPIFVHATSPDSSRIEQKDQSQFHNNKKYLTTNVSNTDVPEKKNLTWERCRATILVKLSENCTSKSLTRWGKCFWIYTLQIIRLTRADIPMVKWLERLNWFRMWF